MPDPADECSGPGWRLPCDGDASNDGVYQTLFFKTDQEATVQADLTISGSISECRCLYPDGRDRLDDR